MTSISLREYVHNIENLTAKGKAAYAEQHCKHVLYHFPKHVEVYRLLGKSCLDLEKTDEAGDIFQRVLSVIPDDFVSLVGLGIIKEDQEDLDSSIWYMERASEVDPSNTDIRLEIQRIYFKRDGIFPMRVRISYGSLLRMYLKGKLFSQAISKTRSALAEEPHRIDLQLILARAYYQSGRKMEAAETCIQIVNQLPFCLEANKILFIICSSMNRTVESRIFQQRINEIEPYSTYISKAHPSPAQVPDEAITLQRLEVPLLENELYIPTGEEPAAELIKILSSPISSTKFQSPTDDQKTSIRFSIELNKEKPGSPENNLPDWLKNFSPHTERDQENTQHKENESDWIDFLNSPIPKFTTETDIRQIEPPIAETPESEHDRIVGWLNTLDHNEIKSPATEPAPLINNEFVDDDQFFSQLLEDTINDTELQEVTTTESKEETLVSSQMEIEDKISLQEQLRSILMHEEDRASMSMVDTSPNSSKDSDASIETGDA